MSGSDTALAGFRGSTRAAVSCMSDGSCRVNSQSPPQVLAAGLYMYRSTSSALLRVRNGIVCRAAKQVLATCALAMPACSTGDGTCAHPFSSWQVQAALFC